MTTFFAGLIAVWAAWQWVHGDASSAWFGLAFAAVTALIAAVDHLGRSVAARNRARDR